MKGVIQRRLLRAFISFLEIEEEELEEEEEESDRGSPSSAASLLSASFRFSFSFSFLLSNNGSMVHVRFSFCLHKPSVTLGVEGCQTGGSLYGLFLLLLGCEGNLLLADTPLFLLEGLFEPASWEFPEEGPSKENRNDGERVSKNEERSKGAV